MSDPIPQDVLDVLKADKGLLKMFSKEEITTYAGRLWSQIEANGMKTKEAKAVKEIMLHGLKLLGSIAKEHAEDGTYITRADYLRDNKLDTDKPIYGKIAKRILENNTPQKIITEGDYQDKMKKDKSSVSADKQAILIKFLSGKTKNEAFEKDLRENGMEYVLNSPIWKKIKSDEVISPELASELVESITHPNPAIKKTYRFDVMNMIDEGTRFLEGKTKVQATEALDKIFKKGTEEQLIANLSRDNLDYRTFGADVLENLRDNTIWRRLNPSQVITHEQAHGLSKVIWSANILAPMELKAVKMSAPVGLEDFLTGKMKEAAFKNLREMGMPEEIGNKLQASDVWKEASDPINKTQAQAISEYLGKIKGEGDKKGKKVSFSVEGEKHNGNTTSQNNPMHE